MVVHTFLSLYWSPRIAVASRQSSAPCRPLSSCPAGLGFDGMCLATRLWSYGCPCPIALHSRPRPPEQHSCRLRRCWEKNLHHQDPAARHLNRTYFRELASWRQAAVSRLEYLLWCRGGAGSADWHRRCCVADRSACWRPRGPATGGLSLIRARASGQGSRSLATSILELMKQSRHRDSMRHSTLRRRSHPPPPPDCATAPAAPRTTQQRVVRMKRIGYSLHAAPLLSATCG